jgi:Phage-related protein
MEFIKIIPVSFYREESGNEPVREWLRELSDKDRRIIGKDIRIVQIDWPVGGSLVKSLSRGLWEVRSKLDNRISRILFVFHEGAIILLHGFIKKTQKTPPQEIELARKRANKLEGSYEK